MTPEKGIEMTTARRQHFVTFLSPGTFVSEATTEPIDRHDQKLAVAMAEKVVERYGAKPYGFRFETRIVGEMPDGEGGALRAEKLAGVSGIHFLGGKLETFDEVARRNDPKEETLRFNMRANGYWLVVVNTNSFKSTMPFGAEDRIVDAAGDVVESGDDPKWVTYRAEMSKRYERGEVA